MALFQTSVLKKYLKQLDKVAVDKAYKAYTKYFLHPTIQENIRNSKEEQYQATFLNELFVNLLGYTLNPKPNFNLTTELKNEKGAKKADGAILNAAGKAIAVIELKGTNTKDLESIRQQAFDYKANHTDCVYVVTSNFEKLRFYIHNAVEFLEFNLFHLSPERFALLYLCLHKEHILAGLAEKIKNDSVLAEEDITKTFYADYSVFKRELYRDLVKQNMKNDVFRAELDREDADRGKKNIKLMLFKKSQKLIDRFLFIFFAEDRGLLPPNSITLIINEYNQLKELDRAEPLYDTYKLYFKYLDQGRAGTDKKAEIFAYNGGLFKPDAVLDSLLISDDLLLQHTSKLTKYDFESQVDVNILGHIFENSLNEIESVNAEIEGKDFDKQKTKRKKDGVFYTPKYITKYIVDNTVGKLCEEKKVELKLDEAEYHKGRKNRQKKTLESLLAKLDKYRDWLLTLTICDPACGSGAFLNQALDFLIKEHTYVDELKQALLGGALVLSDIENTILERNIYGVDLNEESVEIAKLSLWLRTAQPRRKLNSLNNNIKCGNSLIDSKAIAGDKAFKWEEEFPEVFADGGFDVVIGNPPYGAGLMGKDWLKSKFSETSFGNIDSYKYFVQAGIQLTKNGGKLSYIMPDSYLEKEYFKDLRTFITDWFSDISNIKLGDDVFEEVNLPTAILVLENKSSRLVNYKYLDISSIPSPEKPLSLINIKEINKTQGTLDFRKSFVFQKSIINRSNTFSLIQKYDQVMGVKVYQKGKGKPKQTDYEISNDVFISSKLEDEFNYKFISQGIERYYYRDQSEYISYGEWLAEPRKQKYFDQAKLVLREIVNPRIFATKIIEPAVIKNIAAVIITDDKQYSLDYLLGIINSKLMSFYINEQSPKSSNKSYPSFSSRMLKELPIAKANKLEIKSLEKLVVAQLSTVPSLKQSIQAFLTYLQSQFGVEKWSKKMQQWYTLEFGEFIKELNKAISKRRKEIEKEGLDITLPEKLTKLQEMEWMEVFETKRAEAQALKVEIDKTDREIDAMVYELYGLTEEEIEIVENS